MNENFLQSIEFWVKEAEEHEHEARYALDQLRCDITDIKRVVEFYRKKVVQDETPHSERDWS
jgi:hypothetical protein